MKTPVSDIVETARAAFVAGLVHATLAQVGWHVHEAAPPEGRCTVGCASIFGAGFVADITVTVRQVDELHAQTSRCCTTSANSSATSAAAHARNSTGSGSARCMTSAR
jgi:hypothetical protein